MYEVSVRHETTNLLLLKFGPFLLVVDQEASSGLGVTHLELIEIDVLEGYKLSRGEVDGKKVKSGQVTQQNKI